MVLQSTAVAATGANCTHAADAGGGGAVLLSPQGWMLVPCLISGFVCQYH